MKPIHFLLAAIVFLGFSACSNSSQNLPEVLEVASFTGQQVTGVTVSDQGRVFANFPRWREGVKFSVVEVSPDGASQPFPNANWNQWEIGDAISNSVLVAVQSVVAKNDKLYVLDTRNPQFKGVLDAPRIFVFDLSTNTLSDVLMLTEGSYTPNSYTNDLRIDLERSKIYITDSNAAGLIVYDLNAKTSRRVLDNHYSTTAETDHLTINGEKWGGKPVHSDGIALSPNGEKLYFHSLTGYTLYSVSTDALSSGSESDIENSVIKEAKTSAPDGMIFDAKGNLYFADLEENKINYLPPNGQVSTLVSGEAVKWADTFSIYDGFLYYTNSRINETKGGVEQLTFTINKVKI